MTANWQAIRHWLYIVLAVAQPVLLFYGISSEQEIVLWVSAITTLLGAGAATAYSGPNVTVERVG